MQITMTTVSASKANPLHNWNQTAMTTLSISTTKHLNGIDDTPQLMDFALFIGGLLKLMIMAPLWLLLLLLL
jgi:hypothetical protein